jgi:H+/Cl- antiporter ClcA
MAEVPHPPPDPDSIMRSRQFLRLLALAVIVGVVASFLAWCFLELVHELQDGVYKDLPKALGYDSAPIWWSLPVLAIAGVVVAFAIARLPGRGGHIPAEGLNPSPTQPVELPGVILAAVAGIGLGVVVGPEAPLIALGGGLGLLAVRLLRADAPDEVGAVIAASGTFAALSFLFGSPLIAAVLLIEAAALGGRRLTLILIPGLLAAGIGSLVSIGMGSWTGVDASGISLAIPPMPEFARPDLVDFLWTGPLAMAVAVLTSLILQLGRETARLVGPRPFLFLPAIGIAVSGLAIAFSEATDKEIDQVLFSGQEAIGPLIADADEWSLSALALLIGFKGIAYGLSLGAFRGGPVFPAILLGVAGGLMAAQLPGFEITPAVGVAIGAATVAVLRLPLAAVLLATLLTSNAGLGAGPVIIVGVVVAYLTTLALPERPGSERAEVRPEPAAA